MYTELIQIKITAASSHNTRTGGTKVKEVKLQYIKGRSHRAEAKSSKEPEPLRAIGSSEGMLQGRLKEVGG